ncbi:hypothetical protein [Streptomyces sp. NPDC093071]|uniref:hypothetical protein n=1 Tax=Streptomyces sp. NPDC093071 TaxID=3366022 RepID=UPI00380E4C25
MVMLDKTYIESHMADVQNYESFGRNLAEAILLEALKRVEHSPQEEVEFMTKIKIEPAEIEGPMPRLCIWFTVHLGAVPVWVHVSAEA